MAKGEKYPHLYERREEIGHKLPRQDICLTDGDEAQSPEDPELLFFEKRLAAAHHSEQDE